MDALSPGIGHNRSPREMTTERVEDLVKAANAWATDVSEIATEEQARKMADLIDQCRLARQDTDARRKAERKPYDDQIAEVQEAYNPLLDLLNACETVLKKLKKGWLDRLDAIQKAEAKRKAEEARKAQEAADIAAAALAAGLAKPVEGLVAAAAATAAAATAQEAAARAAAAKPQVIGELGGRASGFRTAWVAVIDDWPKVAVALSNHPTVRAALQQVANAQARAAKQSFNVPGATAKQERVV